MKKLMKQLWLTIVSAVCWVGSAVAADIQYVADNGGGEYSGAGYGISVSVSAPATGAVVKYSESEAGPWQDEPIAYRDVCDAKPIYFQISATGYTTVTDSRTVTITPKTLTSDFVWLVLPTEDYVYDGTAKTPEAASGDGDPSIITPNDFDVAYSGNVNAGTAKATFTGKGNYTGTVEEEFEILKADNEWTTEPAIAGWTYGQTPSEPTSAAKDGTVTVTYGTAGATRPTLPGNYTATFTVPESQNYNALTKDVGFTISPATINYVADNVSGEYNGQGYGIAATISVSAPASGAAIKYAESEAGPWQDEPIAYRDVCDAKPIYFQISATGYTTVTDSRTVTITPKTLTSDFVWLVLPTEDYVYDGTAKIPEAASGDGDPSIVTPNDFDVAYSGNVNAGTAKATFTGKGNYTGTVEEEFEILKADNEWTTEPAIAGWTYGQTPSEPTSAAKSGTATVTYGTAGTTRPTLPGTYTATFTVAESQNYNALTKDVGFTISPATINYVADNVSGEYNGQGYGIAATISVSAPASGAEVKYSESQTGPWQDEPIAYRDVCDAKPIYFQISATGYTTVTDSRTVTITPKTLTSDFVWLVLPTEDYVYDGTAKTPEAACGDGDPSIITENDFDVSYSDNKNAGTAKATFTGKGNYTGTVDEEFEILKADNEWTIEPAIAGWTYGQTPSEPTSAAKSGTATVTYSTMGTTRPTLPGNYTATFTVPESQNYNALTKDVGFTISPATINYVADNVSGEYNGQGYGIAATISVSAPASGAEVKYSESQTGPWQDEPIAYRDVCDAKPIYFQISAEGYTTVTDSRTVTITPKTLTSDFVWLVLPTEDYVYDGTAKTPEAACGDGDPSIITPNDFDVAYSGNVNAGTAKATFTGKGNYTGTVEEEFEILKADNEWTTEPAIAGWTYGQTPSEPTSAAKDGTAVVTYGTAGTTRPTLPGTYTATFTVAESQNYNALTKDVEFKISPATINYVADNVSGEYNGQGYGIAATISVSAPASGAEVKYSESQTGPWQAEPIAYKDVCNAKPVWFQISAEGYTTVTDSRTVTVTPKTLTSDFVWLVLPTEDYVYDGTAKTPEAACGDGDPSIITPDDFDVAYSGNVNAGTAKATFTGKGNYTGTVEEEFEILKAKLNGGDEPGGGTVPAGGLSKFDVTAEYDGAGHTVDAAAILAAWQEVDAGVAVGYALNRDAADWTEQPEAFINVCATSVWYKVTLENYDDFVKEVKVAVTPRDIANASIEPIADVAYSGSPAEPVPVVTDGNPSIVTPGDYDVTYSGNDAPGTAMLTLTGKRNYTGTTTANFTIVEQEVASAALSAEIEWKYLRTTGTYFAQIKVACTNGLDSGIDNLRFVFADRFGFDGKTNAALWDTQSHGANPDVAEFGGVPCRFVALDASLIVVQGKEYVFGVSDLQAETVPIVERTIELYTRRRVVPCAGNETRCEVDDFTGYLVWTSGDAELSIPVLADGGAGAADVPAALPRTQPGRLEVAVGQEAMPFVAGETAPDSVVKYFGVLMDEEGAVRGSVEMKLTKANRRTGRRKAKLKVAPIGASPISFTGAVNADGEIQGTVSGCDVALQTGEDGATGTFGPWSVSCARACGTSRDDIVPRGDWLKGSAYGITLGTLAADNGFVRKSSEINVTVLGRGKARITGVLADGTRVSATSKVVAPDGVVACVPVVVRAFRGKKGGFGFLLWVDGDDVSVTGLSGLDTTGAKKAFVLEWDVSWCGSVQ